MYKSYWNKLRTSIVYKDRLTLDTMIHVWHLSCIYVYVYVIRICVCVYVWYVNIYIYIYTYIHRYMFWYILKHDFLQLIIDF